MKMKTSPLTEKKISGNNSYESATTAILDEDNNMMTLRQLPGKSLMIGALGMAMAIATEAAIVNIDFQGVRNVPGPDEPGPIFIGQGAAGGGTSWNGLGADSRLADGTDDDNLTVSGNNLLDDLGISTVVGFTVGPVGGDVCCAAAVTDPLDPLALFNEYIFNNSAGNNAGESPFTITGLGGNATVDLYFYQRSGAVTIEGVTSTDFSGDAPFTQANTTYFKEVPVTGGKITGTMGGGVAVLWGLSISAPQAFGTPAAPSVKSTSPTGNAVRTSAVITVQLQDSATLVVTNSIKLFLNGQAVSPAITRAPGTNVNVVSYDPKGTLQPETTNTVRVVFSSNASPPVTQTNDFSFFVINDQTAALVLNLDFNGLRPDDTAGPTYIGQGAALGGTAWNGLSADSTSGDDNLTVSGSNLVDSIGNVTTAAFTISPVGGDNNGAGADPNGTPALFGDYVFVASAGQTSGTADFTISGLGAVPAIDLYFYFGANGDFEVPGNGASDFAGTGIFTRNNTRVFRNVPVSGGTVTGKLGKGAVAVLNGLTIRRPAPAPLVFSTSPSGTAVLSKSGITVQLLDYVSQVAPNSIQLSVNGQTVSPTITKAAGSNLTVISYQPAGSLTEGPNTVRIVFGDNATPSLVQTNQFSFSVINEIKAANIVNIDFNGTRNVPGNDKPGPTYSGQGAGGGGTVWNGIEADSRLDDGTDEDNLTVGGNNLVNSLGGATTIGFTASPVAGDLGGAVTQDPTATAALFSDYIFNNSAANLAGLSPFTISGLGSVPLVDLYFYKSVGIVAIAGVTPTTISPVGIFTAGNTLYFRNVPVTGGSVDGNFGPGTTVISGLSIVSPLPQPFVKSTLPAGNAVRANTPIQVELQDYVTQVTPNSIQLRLNGQAVSPTINKPAGASITTVTYQPGSLPADSTNVVTLIFSDNAASPVTQTNQFSFVMLNEVRAAAMVNLDFNGTRNVPGPDAPGPTYSGQGAAGGGTVWNGITADSRLEDGTDEDNLTVSGANFVNSLGGATTVGFTVAPMGGDVGGASTTDPAAMAALYSDYIFNNSAGNTAGQSPFTISGLGNLTTVDLYFYKTAGAVAITGVATTPFTATGIFTSANTAYYKNVPVTGGSVSGNFGPGVTVIEGITIILVTPPPGPLSISRVDSNVVISWPGGGTLQRADDVNSAWTDILNAASPQTITPADAHKFYRLRQ